MKSACETRNLSTLKLQPGYQRGGVSSNRKGKTAFIPFTLNRPVTCLRCSGVSNLNIISQISLGSASYKEMGSGVGSSPLSSR